MNPFIRGSALALAVSMLFTDLANAHDANQRKADSAPAVQAPTMTEGEVRKVGFGPADPGRIELDIQQHGRRRAKLRLPVTNMKAQDLAVINRLAKPHECLPRR